MQCARLPVERSDMSFEANDGEMPEAIGGQATSTLD